MPRRRSAARDAIGIECARLWRAFAVILDAATASLLLQYAARLAAASATSHPSGRVAAIAALEQERDAALAALKASLRQQRKDAIDRARRLQGRAHFHAIFSAGRPSRIDVPQLHAPSVRRPLNRSRIRRVPGLGCP
jgi:hypothetical protein